MTAETILFVTIAALLEIFVTLILMLAITFAELEEGEEWKN